LKGKKKNLLVSDDYDLKMVHKSLVFANITENCSKMIAGFISIGEEV